MRTGSRVTGIIAGLLALVSALMSFALSGTGAAMGQDVGDLPVMGYVMTATAVVGFLAAGMATARPGLAALLLVGCGVAAFLYGGAMFIILTPLFWVSALLAALGMRSTPSPAAPAPPSPAG